MRPYELVVLLHPDLEIDADAAVKKIEDLAEAAGGKVIARDNWGKKRTAYRVKKQDFAVYIRFELQLDPGKVRGLENNLLLTEEIIRHLLVTKEAAAKPAPEKSEKEKVTASKEEEK